MDINQRVQYSIISSKKKLGDLAKLLGVSQPSVTRYLNGSQKPGDEILLKLANVTDQNYEWLKTGSGKVPLGFKDFIGSTGLSKEELVQKIHSLESKVEKLQSDVL